MKKLALIAAFAAAVLAFNAQAHGPSHAQHGGIVATASDLGFELVAKDGNVTLYIEDHDEPYATQGASGKLTVLNGTEKSEADLKPAGENKLQATGVKLAKGAKVVAAVTLPDKKVVTVRFTVR
jgi:hypothetical protein